MTAAALILTNKIKGPARATRVTVALVTLAGLRATRPPLKGRARRSGKSPEGIAMNAPLINKILALALDRATPEGEAECATGWC